MADLSIVNLDPSLSDAVRYELGPGNWRPLGGAPWIPDLTNPGDTVPLDDDQVIDILILGDGYETRTSFEDRLDAWMKDFFAVDVYNRFAGAFRIRALFRRSSASCSSNRNSFYRVAIGASGGDEGEVATGGWETEGGTDNTWFRRQLFDSLDAFTLNRRLYPIDLEVGGDDTVIHNQLARMYSNLVVTMLVRTADSSNASGRTRAVPDTRNPVFDPPNPLWRTLNVAFGSHSLHEFGHAFAYLEDEYISKRGSAADRSNPDHGSVFTLSNLSFSSRLDRVPWQHVSPWGRKPRQAAGAQPSPVVGWLWRGGEDDRGVWHAEYHCLMNGRHKNYAYTTDESTDPTGPDASLMAADLRFRRVVTAASTIPPRYCLWCQEIVVARILEKTGQLAGDDDPGDIDARGRRWYDRWVDTWRTRYWAFFDVDRQIEEREALYANPASEPDTFSEIRNADGSFKRIDKSDLYQPFNAEPPSATAAPAGDEDVVVTMFAMD
jgi:IgA Peptidase M64